jgi:putative ABC transport system permease protein
MKDFHYYTVMGKIEPYFLSYTTRELAWPNTHTLTLAPNQNSGEMNKYITRKFQKYFPDDNIEFTLLDKYIQGENYGFIKMLATLFGVFAFIAIVISATGLFGLVSFITKQRTKEIGIRKANGAVISDLFQLIIKEFIIIIIIAIAIAVPIAHVISTKILHNFAYHIHLGFSIYFLAAIFSILIMFITVSYHILKVALTNPIEALRYE